MSTFIICAPRPARVLENAKSVDTVAKLDAAMMEWIELILDNRP